MEPGKSGKVSFSLEKILFTGGETPYIFRGNKKGETNKEKAEKMGEKHANVDKKTVQKKFQRHEGDTGSSEVQVALITKRIELLTNHLSSHKKDHSSRYGLIKMVSARRRLLDYLKRTDEPRYKKLIQELSIRH
jgi:small subunit ribosomal protein S15